MQNTKVPVVIKDCIEEVERRGESSCPHAESEGVRSPRERVGSVGDEHPQQLHTTAHVVLTLLRVSTIHESHYCIFTRSLLAVQAVQLVFQYMNVYSVQLHGAVQCVNTQALLNYLVSRYVGGYYLCLWYQ